MDNTRRLQQVILGIAKEVDALCAKHGIEYYLCGGSTLGALRHKGFIPWDDDLDIVMMPEHYDRFIEVCRAELDRSKYYFQEGLKDWPLNFSKIKLLGTRIDEIGGWASCDEQRGIYIDVFRLDYFSDRRIGRMWQYFCGKVWLTYLMTRVHYRARSTKKKLMLLLSRPLAIRCVEHFFRHQSEKFNRRGPTGWIGFIHGRTRWSNAVVRREVYGMPTRVPFEDTELPVQERADEFLTITFGDYMRLPPEEKRVGLHITGIDFGKY